MESVQDLLFLRHSRILSPALKVRDALCVLHDVAIVVIPTQLRESMLQCKDSLLPLAWSVTDPDPQIKVSTSDLGWTSLDSDRLIGVVVSMLLLALIP